MVKIEELKKLCNEAERGGFGSDLPMSRNSYFIFAARVALPKLIAVAEAVQEEEAILAACEEKEPGAWRKHSAALAKVKAALAALEGEC